MLAVGQTEGSVELQEGPADVTQHSVFCSRKEERHGLNRSLRAARGKQLGQPNIRRFRMMTVEKTQNKRASQNYQKAEPCSTTLHYTEHTAHMQKKGIRPGATRPLNWSVMRVGLTLELIPGHLI